MGLDDRDYMRERGRRGFHAAPASRERPFSPPKESSTLFIVFFWILLAFLAYKGYGWWQDKQQRERAAKQAAWSSAYEAGRAAQAAGDSQRAPVAREQPAPSRHVPPARPVILEEPPVPAPVAQQPTRTSGTIYLCKSYGGSTFWAQAHCSQHQALIDSIFNVPPGMPFEDQVRMAEERRHTLARQAQSVQATAPAPAANPKFACSQLDEQVRHLDALARQPLSAPAQDRIRSERKAARDAQFSLRC